LTPFAALPFPFAAACFAALAFALARFTFLAGVCQHRHHERNQIHTLTQLLILALEVIVIFAALLLIFIIKVALTFVDVSTSIIIFNKVKLLLS
jgi:hypothetical protein